MKSLDDFVGTPIAGIAMPSAEEIAKVARPFDRGFRDGSRFEQLVLEIDRKMTKVKVCLKRETKFVIIAKIMKTMMGQGKIEEELEAGIGLMATVKGSNLLEALFTKPPSVEATARPSPSQSPPQPVMPIDSPPTQHQLLPSLNGGWTAAIQPLLDHFAVPIRSSLLHGHNRAISWDGTPRGIPCPFCGGIHILDPARALFQPPIPIQGRIRSHSAATSRSQPQVIVIEHRPIPAVEVPFRVENNSTRDWWVFLSAISLVVFLEMILHPEFGMRCVSP
ncbi:hypothetical protein P154DRAFT_582667 [Amniculicola lignicola CBS 123094]|uniref:Uncharacterized protein n=1 Tax=Amniculicola lignicola CBS 123094 TaxID=1392246 RepID=A0A6A5W7F9_9PLEO|nr:hypothetical protein P154DRAFT_582667 [Amniculicola lignicola CBS 123094]